VWTPKIHNVVLMDEIYKVLPRLSKYENTVPINDVRFPKLRFVLQTSRQKLDGMYYFSDFLVYTPHHRLAQIAKVADPKAPLTILLNEQNKEITLSPYTLLNTSLLVGHIAGLNEEDVLCTTLNIDKAAGLSLGMALALTRKVKLVWASEAFDAEKVLAALNSEFCTVLVAQPNELAELMQENYENTNFTTLKKVIVVSTPGNLPTAELLRNIKRNMRASVLVTFGTNETGGVITTTTLNSNFETNVVGKPLPHTEIQIVDGEGKSVPINTEGQLVVKGFNITSGFRNDPELTAKKIKNGYLQTGIRAKIDTNNNLVII